MLVFFFNAVFVFVVALLALVAALYLLYKAEHFFGLDQFTCRDDALMVGMILIVLFWLRPFPAFLAQVYWTTWVLWMALLGLLWMFSRFPIGENEY